MLPCRTRVGRCGTASGLAAGLQLALRGLLAQGAGFTGIVVLAGCSGCGRVSIIVCKCGRMSTACNHYVSKAETRA